MRKGERTEKNKKEERPTTAFPSLAGRCFLDWSCTSVLMSFSDKLPSDSYCTWAVNGTLAQLVYEYVLLCHICIFLLVLLSILNAATYTKTILVLKFLIQFRKCCARVVSLNSRRVPSRVTKSLFRTLNLSYDCRSGHRLLLLSVLCRTFSGEGPDPHGHHI